MSAAADKRIARARQHVREAQLALEDAHAALSSVRRWGREYERISTAVRAVRALGSDMAEKAQQGPYTLDTEPEETES